MPRKRQGAGAAPAAKAQRGGEGGRVMVEGWEVATLPKQPTAGYTPSGQLLPGGRVNACWSPPVVAIAHFYGVTQLPPASLSSRTWPAGAGGGAITAESVLGLRPGDDDEEACEVLEDITGSWLVGRTWGNDEEFIKSAAGVGRSNDVVYGGPTSASDYGNSVVHEPWWDAVKKTIAEGNPVLVLVERLEGKKDKGHTHYLLALGYEETKQRRTLVRSLWLKDPMEGDVLLRAECWPEPGVELLTLQPSGSNLDRYAILEATHLRPPAAGGEPTAAAGAGPAAATTAAPEEASAGGEAAGGEAPAGPETSAVATEQAGAAAALPKAEGAAAAGPAEPTDSELEVPYRYTLSSGPGDWSVSTADTSAGMVLGRAVFPDGLALPFYDEQELAAWGKRPMRRSRAGSATLRFCPLTLPVRPRWLHV